MIVAYHLIFSAYGFWLPNDPRGSWSDVIRKWDLLRFGRATKTTETCSLARRPHDRQQRLAAKTALDFSPVHFDGVQARAVARGFANYLAKSEMSVWACAIMPDHVHLVIAREEMLAEQIAIQLKGAATRQLESEGLHPMCDFKRDGRRVPCCWARGEWKVYLDHSDIPRAINYVRNNPVKDGFKAQEWSFVTMYDGRA